MGGHESAWLVPWLEIWRQLWRVCSQATARRLGTGAMPRWRFYGSAPPPEPLLGDFQDFQAAEREGKESSSRCPSRWVLAVVLLSLLVVSAVWVAVSVGAPPPATPRWFRLEYPPTSACVVRRATTCI